MSGMGEVGAMSAMSANETTMRSTPREHARSMLAPKALFTLLLMAVVLGGSPFAVTDPLPPDPPAQVPLALRSPATAAVVERAPRPADAILAQLSTHDIVLVGESPHRGRRIHEVYAQIVAHPDFAARVDDVMVEFGNALHQPTMDRYLLQLEDVPRDELALCWRDTTQLLVWDSPVYEAFFTSVRALNESLAAGERVRVLLGDPPIDWSVVDSASALEPWLEREGSYVDVLERGVLERDRKALVFIGSGHCLKRAARSGFVEEVTERSWLGQLLEARHPGRSSTIYSFFEKGALQDLEGVAGWTAPTWVELSDHPLGEASFGLIAPSLSIREEVDGQLVWMPLEAEDWPPMSVMVDALLYLGEEQPGEEVAALPSTYADEAYVLELRRRARLLDELFGFEYYVPSVEALSAGG